MKKIKKAQAGAYFAFPNGRVGRTRPLYKDLVEFESMDTTGYSKGKKNFDVTTSRSYEPMRKKTISREEVPSKINEMKKGASRINEYKKPSTKKSSAGSKVTKAKTGKKVSKKVAPSRKKK